MSKRRLTLKTESPNIAWFPFYPQEHKTHNNVSLVMEHIMAMVVMMIAMVMIKMKNMTITLVPWWL